MITLAALLLASPTVVPDLGLRDPEGVEGRIPVRATIPEGAGPFPVVVWSHTGGLDKDAYDPLVQALAGRGYVVLQPTHRDSLLYATEEQKAALMPGEGITSANWADRARQVALVLDRLVDLNGTHPDLKGKLDVERVAVGGHGFGGDTAQLVAGVVTGNGETRSFRHAKARAFISIAPQGVPVVPLEAAKGLDRPLLLVSGDRDIARDRKPAAWRKGLFGAMPVGGKHLLWLTDAMPNFGGITGRKIIAGGPDNEAQVATVAAVATAFLDAYLRDQEAAKDALVKSGVRLTAPATLTSK
ncbi:MAG: alpha/beta hydrolase family protein [Fimbriimonas sp.]